MSSTAMTPTERKRRSRQNKLATRGHRDLTISVPLDRHDDIKALAARLRANPTTAVRVELPKAAVAEAQAQLDEVGRALLQRVARLIEGADIATLKRLERRIALTEDTANTPAPTVEHRQD